MFKRLIIYTAAILLSSHTPPEGHRSVPIKDEVVFQKGEYMRFVVAYGMVKAGEAELSIQASAKNDQHLHIVGTGKSYSFFDVFFKVRDRYETYFNPENKVPTEFVRDINEGGYKKQQHYIFDHEHNWVYDKRNGYKSYAIDHEHTQDMISLFYYARLLDTKDLRPGDLLYIPSFVDEEMFRFYLEFKGREVLKTTFGKVNTLKFTPLVQEGRVFKDKETMTIWVTDDDSHMPVLLKSKLRVGSIRLELAEHRGVNTDVPQK